MGPWYSAGGFFINIFRLCFKFKVFSGLSFFIALSKNKSGWRVEWLLWNKMGAGHIALLSFFQPGLEFFARNDVIMRYITSLADFLLRRTMKTKALCKALPNLLYSIGQYVCWKQICFWENIIGIHNNILFNVYRC